MHIAAVLLVVHLFSDVRVSFNPSKPLFVFFFLFLVEIVCASSGLSTSTVEGKMSGPVPVTPFVSY